MVERDEKGRFVPGSTGNADGRPPAAAASADASAYAAIAEIADHAIDRLATAVAKGDRWAIELVLQRVIPVPKAVPRVDEVTGPRAVRRLASSRAGRDCAVAAVVLAAEERTLDAEQRAAIRKGLA